MKIIEGDYPEGMQARCAWCRRVHLVADGEFVEGRSADGPARLFRCASCAEELSDPAA